MNDEVSAESGRQTAVRPGRAGCVLNERNGLTVTFVILAAQC
jgi:hypothetical protein